MDGFRCSLIFHKEVGISVHVVAKGGERFACRKMEEYVEGHWQNFINHLKIKKMGKELKFTSPMKPACLYA